MIIYIAACGWTGNVREFPTELGGLHPVYQHPELPRVLSELSIM